MSENMVYKPMAGCIDNFFNNSYSKEMRFKIFSNYHTISLISHTSKIILLIILNRLSQQAEDILADEQVGFRKNPSTTKQILNLRILMEKHMDQL